jgi:hypothetical protein
VAICLFRMAPQDLPSSPVLLGIALAAHAASGTFVAVLVLDVPRAVGAGVTGTLLLALLTATLLGLNRLTERIPQTLTALAGCDALIGVLAMPVMYYAHTAEGAQLAAPLVLAMIIWSIAVFGHVLRHALSTPRFVGVVVALVFYWISMSILNHLYPVAT